MKVRVFIWCLILVYFVAFIGSIFTSGTVDSDWYLQNKPSFTPPNWLFGPVWTALYFLIVLSLYFSWTKAKKKEKKKVEWVFGINLVLNSLWSVLFFGLRNPVLSFIDIIAIWISIIMMIFVAGRIDKKAGWILVPYLIWVSFAAVLNFVFR